jgi:hypothetical protein
VSPAFIRASHLSHVGLTGLCCSQCTQNFLLHGPALPSLILHTTYRPMAPFTLTSLMSCYSLMYDSQACVTCSVHKFFTLWACASQLSCVQLMDPWHPLPWWASCLLQSHVWLVGLHCLQHTWIFYFMALCFLVILCTTYTCFYHLFCRLMLPSVVLHTTYGPTLPLYHEHIWQAHDAPIIFGTPFILLLKCIQVTASRQISFTHGSRAIHINVSILVSWIQVLTIFNYPMGGQHSQLQWY